MGVIEGDDKMTLKSDSEARQSAYDWVRILATFFVEGHSAYAVMEVQYGRIDFRIVNCPKDIVTLPFGKSQHEPADGSIKSRYGPCGNTQN